MEEALKILKEIEDNVEVCCAITMDPDDVLVLIDRLKEILEAAEEIHLDSHGVGKYGRVLGQLHVSDDNSPTMLNVNELLIKEGHAVEYHGGKR